MDNRKQFRPDKKAISQVAAGTLAIQEHIARATTEDTSNPVITSMALAAYNSIRQAGDQETVALLIGHLALACYRYGLEKK